ncbi:hypothetical protein GGF31_003770 [Allomyces arbusculus]|nr:hypothetical protein GGF31_003770 [Allomyces arbusculus]
MDASTALAPADVPAPAAPSPVRTTHDAASNMIDLEAALHAHPLFAGLEDDAPGFFSTLLSLVSVRYAAAGDWIVRVGEEGRALFLVLRGSVIVTGKDGETVYSTLGPGSFFGEIAVAMDLLRTANVVALERCVLVVIQKRDLQQTLLTKFGPGLSTRIRHAAEVRLGRSNGNGAAHASSAGATSSAPAAAAATATHQLTSMVATTSAGRPATAAGLHEIITLQAASASSAAPDFSNAGSTASARADFPPVRHALAMLHSLNSSTVTINGAGLSGSDRALLDMHRPESAAHVNVHDMLSAIKIGTTASPVSLDSLLAGEDAASPTGSMTVPTVAAPAVVEHKTLSSISAQAPSKRRASVAVWSDPRLMKMASDVMAKVAAPIRQSAVGGRFASSESFRSASAMSMTLSVSDMHTSANKLHDATAAPAAGDEEHKTTMLDMLRCERASTRILQMLSTRDCFIVRGVCTDWFDWIQETRAVWATHIAFEHLKTIDDGVLALIARDCAPFIRVLNLKNCFAVTDLGFAPLLLRCTNLEELVLHNCWEVSGNSFLGAGTVCLPSVTSLDLSNLRKIDDRALRKCLLMFPNLTNLNLGYCKTLGTGMFVTESAAMAMVSGAKSGPSSASGLARWGPHSAPATATGAMLPATAGGATAGGKAHHHHGESNTTNTTPPPLLVSTGITWRTIRSLNLQRCTGLRDDAFAQWPVIGPSWSLETLLLGDCSLLTDGALHMISHTCSQLRTLGLAFCCALSEQAMAAIVRLDQLRVLDLSFCGSLVSDASVRLLVRKCLALEALGMRGCVRVDDAILDHVLDRCTAPALTPHARPATSTSGLNGSSGSLSSSGSRPSTPPSLSKLGRRRGSRTGSETDATPASPATSRGPLPPLPLKMINVSQCRAVSPAMRTKLAAHVRCLETESVVEATLGAAEAGARRTSLAPNVPALAAPPMAVRPKPRVSTLVENRKLGEANVVTTTLGRTPAAGAARMGVGAGQ